MAQKQQKKTWFVGRGKGAVKHTECVLCSRDTLYDGTGLCSRCYDTGHGFDHLPLSKKKAWVRQKAREFGVLAEKR
jgi:hypothetical protein